MEKHYSIKDGHFFQKTIEIWRRYCKTILFYGTSITHGAAACRPALTYPAIISRNLNCDIYNFGFGGKAQGTSKTIDIIKNINSDIYILKHSRQASSPVTDNIIRMVTAIKEIDINRKIVIISALGDQNEARPSFLDKKITIMPQRRQDALNAFNQVNKIYPACYYVDGLKILSGDESEQFHDFVHPNTVGHHTIAKRLTPIIAKILKE
ncbi:hypothetical protein MTBBW1_2650004 [Desulfamplus magnetovallimortis]|uniref:SGNH hydrolase-type esterase domain-containing protein n=1 Tax=Desulfamplus magnetovallimortis TaxID=1246637 RepID=A0A1W1HEZ8_9BACT|nr:SGNH/GDSL hydrolase family protein [Desulfamplus magnetovallimortis]SLM31067.1 hypothetical protein MTBBW1_2650004 [Desulfamplus magnetovallimortis]